LTRHEGVHAVGAVGQPVRLQVGGDKRTPQVGVQDLHADDRVGGIGDFADHHQPGAAFALAHAGAVDVAARDLFQQCTGGGIPAVESAAVHAHQHLAGILVEGCRGGVLPRLVGEGGGFQLADLPAGGSVINERPIHHQGTIGAEGKRLVADLKHQLSAGGIQDARGAFLRLDCQACAVRAEADAGGGCHFRLPGWLPGGGIQQPQRGLIRHCQA